MQEKQTISDIILDYCEGDWRLEFYKADLKNITEDIKKLVKKEIMDYAEDVASCSRPAEHVDDAIGCIDNL